MEGSDHFALTALDFRRRLAEEFDLRSKKNPAFSFRAFARLLEIDPTSLRKIMAGKRGLGATTIEGLGARLEISSDEISRYVAFHKERRRLGTSLANDHSRVKQKILDQSHIKLLTSFDAQSILQLTRVKSFEMTYESVASALKLSIEQAKSLMLELIEAGWLTKNSDGRYADHIGAGSTDPTDPAMDEARRVFMTEMITRSLDAYAGDPKSHSIHYGRMFRFNSQRRAQVLEKIRLFAEDLEQFAEADPNADDVYQLQVSLFPTTTLYKRR